MRDDFPTKTKELLAKRVAHRCSNPSCRQVTSGPQEDENKAVNVGVASHIAAASQGGPRYDPRLSENERRAPGNGIWLCQTCAKLVDNDIARYTVDVLREWKQSAEALTKQDLEARRSAKSSAKSPFVKLERLMPELLDEMRKDLAEYPLSREFVVLKRVWTYNGNVLCYYYDDHDNLDDKLRILENHGLVRDITYNNTKRYVMTEALADYLTGH